MSLNTAKGFRLIPVPALNIQGSISEALRREVGHVASGLSDHEGGSLDSQDSSEHPSLSNEAMAPPPVPTSSAASGKSARDKIRRQKKRARDRHETPGRPYPSLSKKHPTPEQIPVDFNAANLPAATGAFISKRPKITDCREYTLKELIDDGFRLVDWDGRTPTAILDQEKRIVAALAGRPKGDDWEQVHGPISSLLQDAAGETDGMCHERRGDFVSLSAGVSYGGGQTAPGNLVHTPHNKAIVDMLKEDP
ncbi:hypothetical protein JVT61DRAFT_9115 [Boletus reticuloceps]|uniref:Uncharacterized protein n=1 Tax=Boletus reticuloceps TaxID=495285 RepID=A0A8I3A695_9AGAM|nr:hypothetical protein JVT61DRAFT_9115 [Boletus reticuloceps]